MDVQLRRPASTGELEASVRSFAAEAAQKTVRLELNGATVAEQMVDVQAGGRAQARFAPLELKAGSNRVTVSLAPADELAADDRRFLALKRPMPRSVLVVAADQRGRGASFVSSALATLETLALTPDVKPPARLTERPLTEYSFVVVTDAGLLGSAETAALQDYVEGGGRALLAFGPRSGSLTAVPVGGELLRSSNQLGADRTVSIGEIDATHPALRGVDELRTAKFTRYLPVDPATDDRAPTVSTMGRRCCSNAASARGACCCSHLRSTASGMICRCSRFSCRFSRASRTTCSAARASRARPTLGLPSQCGRSASRAARSSTRAARRRSASGPATTCSWTRLASRGRRRRH